MAGTRTIRWVIGGISAAAALLALPAAASAAVTCSFNTGTGALSVTVTNGTTAVYVGRAASPSTDVLVDDTSNLSSPIGCTNGPATLATTSSIAIDETGSAQGTFAALQLANGRLEPGLDSETGTAEIEVSYTADVTGNDRFQIAASGEGADQHFDFGVVSGTVVGNLNNDDDLDDVVLDSNVDQLEFVPGSGNDTISTDGSVSGFTGTAPLAKTRVFASPGNDTFHTGGLAGSDNRMLGSLGDGNDTMVGGPGNDDFEMAGGNDTYDGAGGSADFASYEGVPSATGVTLDLSQTGPQNTGDLGIDQVANVENAVGSNGNDHLTGTSGANTLFGGNSTLDAGDDVLVGSGGGDDLIGAKGNDLLIGQQGNDLLEGDADIDTASFASGSTGPVTFSLDQALTGVAQATGGAGNDTLDDGLPTGDSNHEIENLIGSPFGGDVLTGNATANQIDVYDGLADTVDCVASADGDVAIADEIGVDSLTLCETTDNAPQTSIDSGPADGATTADSTPTYGVSADETPATFQVKVDSGSFQACAASCTVPSLANGLHTIAFRAIDGDENFHADLTPATRTVSVAVAPPPDTTAPETTIGSHPKPKTKKRRAIFTFSSSEAGSTFLCSVDGAANAPCTSPFTTPKRKKGKHRFDVIATDSAGNRDQSAATFFWKVVKPSKR
jgi:Ca2+-binding RTX toxin-like protein